MIKNKKKIKVILISNIGFVDYSIQLATALAKKSRAYLIIPETIDTPLDNIKRKIPENVKVTFLKQPRRTSIKNLLMIKRLFNIIKGFNPDCIHIQFGHPWICLLMPLLKRYKIITTMHDVKSHVGENSLEIKFINYIIKKYSDAIIVHSSMLKKEFINFYNYKKDNIYVIPHGNYAIYRTKKRYTEKVNNVLFFGRIKEYKGIGYLIKSEKLIRKKIKRFQIVIAGRGENLNSYRETLLNNKNFVIKNYHISETEMIKLFQQCSIVVLPYIEASQSGVIPVAYEFKKPVIATNVGALPDMVINNITGILINPENEKNLAEAIVYLLKNKKIRKEMGKNGYKFANKDLSWKKIANKTISLYKNIINKY